MTFPNNLGAIIALIVLIMAVVMLLFLLAGDVALKTVLTVALGLIAGLAVARLT